MLNNGGIASPGHCVTFSTNEINEQPKNSCIMPLETQIINVKKQGKSYTFKEFIESVVLKLNNPWSGLRILGNNPVYSNTIISNERLQSIPENGQLTIIVTLEFKENTAHKKDEGPSPEQANIGVSQGFTHSGAQLPASNIHTIKVENIFHDIICENHGEVSMSRHDIITIPWPTGESTHVSAFTAQLFFTVVFPIHFLNAQETFCQEAY